MSLTEPSIVCNQEKVDAFRIGILEDVKGKYAPKALVIPFSSSRIATNNDVGNSIACTTSATFTINSGLVMQVGDFINFRSTGLYFNRKRSIWNC